MSRKPFFSERDVKSAMETDTVSFLERHYGYSFRKVGRDFRCKEHNSLVIRPDRRRWYWNSHNVGGENVLSFLQKIEGLSFYEAVQEVVQEPMLPIAPYTHEPKREVADKPLVPFSVTLPPAEPGRYSRAFAYLSKSRGIDANIITYLMKSKRLYQEAVTKNAIFVNYDKDKKPTFFTKQGTNTYQRFKGNAKLPDEEDLPVTYYFENYGFWQEGLVKSRVYVFESPIDLLSHATLANMYKGSSTYWLQHSRIALCGVSDLALEQYLKSHPDVKEIRFGLDNDEAGRKATAKFTEKYTARGYTVKDVSPKQDEYFKGKDYNDKLMHELKRNPDFFRSVTPHRKGEAR